MKEIRFNANTDNSNRLRKLQSEIKKQFAIKVSFDSLANLAIESGMDKVRIKFLNAPSK